MVSVAKLQSWIKVSGETDILASIEAGVVGFLETETDRLFTAPPESIEDILDGGDLAEGDLLPLRTFAALPSVLLREAPSGPVTAVAFRERIESAWEPQDLADFELSGRELISKRGGFPAGARTVKVTYPFGYTVDQEPNGDRVLATAQLAVLQLSKYVYDRRKAGLKAGAGIGPMRITYSTAIDAGVSAMVDSLKRPSLEF